MKNVIKSILLALIMINANFVFAAVHSEKDGVKQNIVVEPVNGLSDDFMKGVDISSLADIESAGGKFYNAAGQEEDLFKILKDNGVNWIRLRVWNNPTIDGQPYGGGNNSVATDIPLAKRAKDAGLKLLIDFHYSDTWADPGKQNMPQDWVKLNAKQLNAAVEKFTRESLEAFISAGARPDAVQIGNELNNGFMWPLGKIWGNEGEKVGGMEGFIALLKSASKGVRAAENGGDPMKIIVHLADGGNNELYRAIFDPLKNAKLDYDIIGLSFYTYWHGSCIDLKKNLMDLSKRYGKELCVMETAYAFTKDDGDDQGNVFMVYSGDTDGYIPSVQGQATAVRDVINTVASVKGGAGVFYWEPAWIPVTGAGLSATEGDTWENQGMFDYSGRALPSLAVWNLVSGKGEVKNVWGGSAKNGGGFVPYDMADPVKVVTMPGVAPILPKMPKIVFTNDKEQQLLVSWEQKDWANETKPGKIILKGKISGSSYTPLAEVEISSKVNLIEDNSFESGKLGKWILNGDDTACFLENNKSNSHNGKYTYKYWLGSGFKSALYQDFKGLENGTYEARVWAMGGGGENDARLVAENFDSKGTVVSAKVENTGWLAWKLYTISFEVTKGQVTLGIYLDTTAGNWGNFDDIELYKIDDGDSPDTSMNATDGFKVDLKGDLNATPSAGNVQSAAPAAEGNSSKIKQGFWVELTSETQSLIRDIATGEKSGYEIDNSHLKSNANWWFWGDPSDNFHLDAEISVWNFDKTMYQANSFAANVPQTTIGDGAQSVAELLWSPINNGNDNGVGSFNKMGFTVATPYVDVKLGYGDLKANGMSEFTGIYNVIDRWLNVGKGFTEIRNGKKLRHLGDNVKLNTIAAFSMMRGTYGMYDIIDATLFDNYEIAATFGSYTKEEQLFFYNKQNINAASIYASAQPLDFLKVELHGLGTFGTDVKFGKTSIAGAGRISYLGDGEWLNVSLMESYAGKDANSVWGCDGQTYDNIKADTLTTQLDFAVTPKDFITVRLDEGLSFYNVDALKDGKITVRNQPVIDFDLEPLTNLGITVSAYGVLNFDRLATETSADREFITSFEEAGIEITAKDLSSFLKKLVADYAVKFEYDDWESGNSYTRNMMYNSIMLNADLTDKINVHAGSLIRVKTEEDKTFVPFGFTAGVKFDSIPLPGKPMFWTHFCYGMNPYGENNYSMYRADNWMNKAPHRTYLLNDLYDDYTTSNIGFGLIWNL